MDSLLRPLAPLLGLVVKRTITNIKKKHKKVIFSLVDNPLPPPPPSGLSTEKKFFCGFPKEIQSFVNNFHLNFVIINGIKASFLLLLFNTIGRIYCFQVGIRECLQQTCSSFSQSFISEKLRSVLGSTKHNEGENDVFKYIYHLF